MLQDEDEVDQGTMVRAGTGDSGTIRAAGSLAGTMIHHQDTDTMLGTLVINSDDEDAGTMKSKNLQPPTHTHELLMSSQLISQQHEADVGCVHQGAQSEHGRAKVFVSFFFISVNTLQIRVSS